jgi:hypothetical protein
MILIAAALSLLAPRPSFALLPPGGPGASEGRQEKVKLEVRSVQGEKYLHESRESNQGDLVVSVAGMEIPQQTKESEVRRYRDEVLAVDGILPSQVRRETKEWFEEKLAPGAAEPEKIVKALQGKTITLKRDGAKTVYEGADGLPEAELKKNRLRPESIFKALPKEAVAVGHDWTVDEKMLLEDFAENADGQEGLKILKASGKGKLEKIEEHKGKRCAVVLYTLEASGHLAAQEAIKVDLTMSARLWISVDAGRPLSLRGEGLGKIAGEIEQGDQKVKLSGTFKIRSEADQTYE